MNSTFVNGESISRLETMSTKSAWDGGAIFVIRFYMVDQQCFGFFSFPHTLYIIYSGSTFFFFFTESEIQKLYL